MSEFFKRNLVWVAILLCIAGVVLSIIGIPTGKPVFFFIGIILSIPTIGYLIYQVFFSREKTELNLNPTTSKISTSNITSIITNKDDILLNDEITNDDDLEPLYNGYANEQEIIKRLNEITNTERERSIIELPDFDLPEAQPNRIFNNQITIEDTTNTELLRQRVATMTASNTFNTEVPAELVEANETIQYQEKALTDTNLDEINNPETIDLETENVNTQNETQPEVQLNNELNVDTDALYVAPSLDDPNYIPTNEPIAQQAVFSPELAVKTLPHKLTPVDLTNASVIRINAESIALRRQKAQEKKSLLSQINLERYLRRYFVETAACFLMDRTIYKDKNGIAPYNKFAVNKNTNLPEYIMSNTKGRLYKFCTYLVDAERFITHQVLYDDFITAIEQGVSLSRISETLHPLYRKKYKKDFVLNLSNREDWDNVMILVYNNYILNNDNFKDIFTRVPFEIPVAYSEENIVDYLKDADLQERFEEKYIALEEMGVPTFWDAIYICFINSIKQKLTTEQLETALLREYKKIARALKRADNARRKMLKKAS